MRPEGDRFMREVTAYEWVPGVAQGFVKDLRVRWALEEAGLPYTERLISLEQKLEAAHLARQPFAQVPVYRDDQADLFESGAIVLRIAETSNALMPGDEAARARVTSWAFAALNSVEPFVANVTSTELFFAGEAWAPGYIVKARELLDMRLTRLADWMKDRDYLEGGRFTAGDLLMASVLRDLERHDVFDSYPGLADYCARCLARPAFKRALTAQLKVFAAHTPASG